MTTKIEWTDESWNPMTGCTKVSSGCEHCYAERMAKRLRGRFGYPEDDPFRVTLHPDRLERPLRWRKPRRVFVCSMGDLFHKDVPFDFIDKVFSSIILSAPSVFQVLTKRPARMAEYICELYAGHRGVASASQTIGEGSGFLRGLACADATSNAPIQNLWLGTSLEDQATADERIPQLLECPAAVRFVSCEPLLSAVDLQPYLYGGEIRCHACKEVFQSWDAEFCGGHECELCKTARAIDDCCAFRSCTDDQSLQCPKCGKCACGRMDEWEDRKKLTGSSGRYSHQHTDLRWKRLLDWAIVGGESGHGARPCDIRWITSIRDQCKTAGVPVFIKQLGSNSVWREITRRGRTETWREKRRVFHDSKGSNPAEWPHDLRIREYPTLRALEGGGND